MTTVSVPQYTFLEFFAGGGMARLGLGENWRCLFANDVDPAKCAAYRENFGADDLVETSIAALSADDLPRRRADLAWASFPCQDLSLAGARAGMGAGRSGLFFEFWRLMRDLAAAGRAPRTIVIENVVGLQTSNRGADFAAIVGLLMKSGYEVAAGVVDAVHFTPQSRPRLFIVGLDAKRAARVLPGLAAAGPSPSLPATPPWTIAPLPTPGARANQRLIDIIDWDGDAWDAEDKTRCLRAMMSRLQGRRLDAIAASGERRVGAGFRRTRREDGKSVQRFEARFDGLAGCLRTPAGGSSRQIVIAAENGTLRSRLLSPREAARLMGLPDDYRLPASASAALKLCGDGVCAPVVRWIGETLLEPALGARRIAA